MTSEPLHSVLQDNLEQVRARIEAAAQRSGRTAADVTLVAVTKYVPPEILQAMLTLGVRDLGENRVQQFAERVEAFGSSDATLRHDSGRGPRWHMIGHLQRNKIRKLVPSVRILHSLDSLRLAEALQQRAAQTEGCVLDCFVEVNVSGEASKDGLTPEDAPPLLEQLQTLPAINPIGLMTMAPRTPTPDGARPHFAALRELRDKWVQQGLLADEAGLSMGMSGDYAVAVEEGATVVRVGSALYEGIER